MSGQPSITVNGEPRPYADSRVHTTLLDWLRDRGLTGAKEGCAEGECGACSVLVSRPSGPEDAGSQWTPINSCLVPACAYDGQEVVTAEGLGAPDRLHPVQREMAERGGSQCGYCTPGFVCSMAAEFYRRDRAPGEPDHEHGENGFDLHALSGNLCRCTGYRPIRDAAFALAAPDGADPLADRLTRPAPTPVTTRLERADGGFLRPGSLTEALAFLADHPDAVVVAGSTDWGVEVNLRGRRAPAVVMVDQLAELRGVTSTGSAHRSTGSTSGGDASIEIGAALSLTELERQLAGRVQLLDQVWPQFASRLIRNGATLGGNLATASPIGDTPPALLALEAELVLVSSRGDRVVPLADFFTGYRQTVRAPDELIRAVRIPLPASPLVAFHKIAKRRFDDISSVAVGIALDVVDGTISKARIGLGGVAATPIRALATEQVLEGRPWTEETVAAAAEVMRGEGTPLDDMRASAAYRAAMLGTALPRLFAEVRDD